MGGGGGWDEKSCLIDQIDKQSTSRLIFDKLVIGEAAAAAAMS
jgi:hypothetical protein